MTQTNSQIVGKVIYTKHPSPYNWIANDKVGIITAAPTKRECQRRVAVLRKTYGSQK